MNWRPRRFWQEAGVAPAEEGFAVLLDGRAAKTPAGTPLVLPARALAQAVAAEWAAQEGELRPEAMPLTRAAHSALDKLPADRPAVVADLAGYGGSDLLCYRAEGPAELIAIQAVDWDPLLDWVREVLGAPLAVTRGVMPVAQDEAALARLAARVEALDTFRLAAFHDLVVLSGSLVLALAVLDGRLEPQEAWRLSRLDEDWQIALWGADEEAEAKTARRREAFLTAARFLELLGPP